VRKGTPVALAITSDPRVALRSRRSLATILAAVFAVSGTAALSAGSVSASDHATGDPGSHEREAYDLGLRTSVLPWLAELGWTGSSDAPLASDDLAEATDLTEVREVKLRPRPKPGPFSMNLYSEGDFRSQQTSYWCIPASTQLMMNMMDPGPSNRSRAMQARLYRIGDNLEEDGTFSDDPEPDDFRGMGISEWVGLLNRFDYGPYELGGSKSRQNALKKAARLMRKTGKPVGLVVWHGAHAWVMSGFTATADPARTRDFTVTSVWVHDPWYPRTSSIWGRSRGPNANISPTTLGQDYLPYGRPGRRNPDRDGRYMLVLPKLEPGIRLV
jgi:hypothetical protein